jgi:WD40 repeat protein
MKNAMLLLSAVAGLYGASPGERTLVADAAVESICFAPDGKTIVATYADKHVRTWDVDTGKVVGDRPMGGILLSSKILGEPSADRKSAQIWDLAAARRMFKIDKEIASAALSSDGKQLAISS